MVGKVGTTPVSTLMLASRFVVTARRRKTETRVAIRAERSPTEERATWLAEFFKLDEKKIQAWRIAERSKNDIAENPVAKDAIAKS